MQELELAALARDVAEHGLRRGDVGTMVFVHRGGVAYEVEFMTGGGKTLAVLTLPAEDVHPVRGDEIQHARALADSETPVGG